MARIPGEGLAKGLAVTLRHMLSRADTQQYPEVRPDLPPRSRGVIGLVEENCTVCMLCARECPDWCIYIDSHKETAPAPEGGRPRAHNVLDRFAIDFSLCMYCGICIEVCPFDALFWSPEFEYAEHDIRNLLHEKDRLGEWAQTIPIPPPHEPNAEPPKEIAAASRPPRERPGPQGGTTRGAASGTTSGIASGTTSGAASGTTGGAASGTTEPARPVTGPHAGHAAVRAIRPPGALPKKPTPTEPASTAPASGEPASTEPARSEPASSEASRIEPASTAPDSGEPASTAPARSEPASSEPPRIEPASTAPDSGEPASTEPASAGPVAGEPSARAEGPKGPEDTGSPPPKGPRRAEEPPESSGPAEES
ncbi:hypothetical protein GCM10022226_10830 [Sphaerisporangium flaviroseum]|uniref:NADH-quinone oxidoreductase subunit I n=1 Tax=Sphaerisporangium flaviroseum TaxID=509199 RepID=A0ABP7HIB9_9ACTN